MSLQTRAKFFGTHFLHSYLSELGLIGEWQYISYENTFTTFTGYQFDAKFWRCELSSYRSTLYFSFWVSPEQYCGDLAAIMILTWMPTLTTQKQQFNLGRYFAGIGLLQNDSLTKYSEY